MPYWQDCPWARLEGGDLLKSTFKWMYGSKYGLQKYQSPGSLLTTAVPLTCISEGNIVNMSQQTLELESMDKILSVILRQRCRLLLIDIKPFRWEMRLKGERSSNKGDPGLNGWIMMTMKKETLNIMSLLTQLMIFFMLQFKADLQIWPVTPTSEPPFIVGGIHFTPTHKIKTNLQ